MGVSEPLQAGSVNLLPEDGSSGSVSLAGGSVNLAPTAPPLHQLGNATGLPSVSPSPPPVAAAATAGMAQQVMQRAAASTAAQSAKGLLQRGASSITLHVQSNPYSITVMSLVGGVFLTVTSFLNIINIHNMFNPLLWILQLYQLAAGVLIIVIDGPSERLPAFLRERLFQSAAMLLHSNTNRILFYLFIACQHGSQAGIFNWIVGWYFAFVAGGFAALHASSAQANDEVQPPMPA